MATKKTKKKGNKDLKIKRAPKGGLNSVSNVRNIGQTSSRLTVNTPKKKGFEPVTM